MNGQLQSIIDRIERLEEEKKALAADIKEIYAEAKGNGFDTKILRKLVAIRKKDAQEREEEQAMLEIYMQALGMLADTPLGQAAVQSHKAPETRRNSVRAKNAHTENDLIKGELIEPASPPPSALGDRLAGSVEATPEPALIPDEAAPASDDVGEKPPAIAEPRRQDASPTLPDLAIPAFLVRKKDINGKPPERQVA